MAPMLQVKDLRTQFFTEDGIVNAVNGISFDLDEGQTLGIVGESGCGKSVSMLSVMGLVPSPPGRVVGGEVFFQDRDLLKLKPEEMRQVRGHRIAMIFQDPMTSLNPVLTVARQISEALVLHMGMDNEQARNRTIELLEMVHIPAARNRVDDYPHQFSGGMRQRVMIAMALSCNPQILIADEPTTALDVTIQAQIIDLIRELRQDLGMAIIWITHDLGIVAGLVDHVQVMYAGFIVERAEVHEFYANPRHPYSLGLMGSLPRLDARQRAKLTPIDGLPPDLIALPPGCPFYARCRFRLPRCLEENPTLRSVNGGDHEIACWVDITTGGQVR